MNVKTKILLLAILSNVVLAVTIYCVMLSELNTSNDHQVEQIEHLLISEKQEYLKDIVKTAYSIMDKYSSLEDEDVAKAKVKQLLSTPRYDVDGSAYLFAYQINADSTYSFAFHGTKKTLWDKKTDINKPDANGVQFRKMLIEGALKGGELVDYSYTKGGSKELKPKMAYALHFKKWNWVLVGGIYMDNVEVTRAAQQEELDNELSQLLWFVLSISITLVVLSSVIALWIASKISRPISDAAVVLEQLSSGDTNIDVQITTNDEIALMQKAMLDLKNSMNKNAVIAEAIADGDLTSDVVPVSSADRLGNAFKMMAEKLNSVMLQIKTTSVEVDAGAKQVSDSSQSLSAGATTSAASIEEISSSMTEIESQVKTSAENATQANQLAASARDAAETGSNEMGTMLEAMTGISESSQQIAKIIKVIDDIAFQTNLLALNAAVEAARAGAHGKGFAVVAEEVRSLAGRSAKAASETADLIEDAVKRVENGNSIADKTGNALAGIVEQVTKVTDLVGEIASASKEQALGVSQVSVGLEQIDGVTQSNTANAEETAAASEQLSAQATELQSSIARFRIKNEDNLSRSSQPVAARGSSKQIGATVQNDQWGNDSSFSSRNEQIISLDDDNFGKY